jgi:hypothetical protein
MTIFRLYVVEWDFEPSNFVRMRVADVTFLSDEAV